MVFSHFIGLLNEKMIPIIGNQQNEEKNAHKNDRTQFKQFLSQRFNFSSFKKKRIVTLFEHFATLN